MKLWRKVLYGLMFTAVGGFMIFATVELFSDLSKAGFLNWLKTMLGGASLILYGVYRGFAKGEWAEKHPRGAKIADICGWVGIAFHGLWIWMRFVL